MAEVRKRIHSRTTYIVNTKGHDARIRESECWQGGEYEIL